MPKSTGGVSGWMFATGTASVDCTNDASIRTQSVSASLELGDGVPDGVSDGVSEGICETDTSGGALGASS